MLIAQGAPIQGEAGLGYVLRPGYLLPPLMFGEEELDALILGLRLVARHGDPALGRAADDALARIVAVLPPEKAEIAETSGLLAAWAATASPHLAAIRRAMRTERKLLLRYTDKQGRASERVVWPVALGFFEAAEVLAAWCEMRQGFRHFRLDRIAVAEETGTRFPTRRRLLLAEWRLLEGVGDPG